VAPRGAMKRLGSLRNGILILGICCVTWDLVGIGIEIGE